ncbi:MAG: hypothetical protein ACHP84_03760 [Caulobacterales bacterium]
MTTPSNSSQTTSSRAGRRLQRSLACTSAAAAILMLVAAPASAQVAPNVKLPPIPHCYSFSSDREELLAQLERLRQRTAVSAPLGGNIPDNQKALAQFRANVAAVEAAIKQAEATPYCPIEMPPKPNIMLPAVPACYGNDEDKSVLLAELRRISEQVARTAPLGGHDPANDKAWAQFRANVAAVQAAIAKAEAAGRCKTTEQGAGQSVGKAGGYRPVTTPIGPNPWTAPEGGTGSGASKAMQGAPATSHVLSSDVPIGNSVRTSIGLPTRREGAPDPARTQTSVGLVVGGSRASDR